MRVIILRMARLYDSKQWRILRAAQLSAHPLCAFCFERGIIQAATVADHITPHRQNPKIFFDPDNLQSLCKYCHDSHKQRLEKSGRVIGADLNGNPLAPDSHWFK